VGVRLEQVFVHVVDVYDGEMLAVVVVVVVVAPAAAAAAAAAAAVLVANESVCAMALGAHWSWIALPLQNLGLIEHAVADAVSLDTIGLIGESVVDASFVRL